MSLKKKETGPGMVGRLDRAWVQLPKSVVTARAGLIPSYETDVCPPPARRRFNNMGYGVRDLGQALS